MHRVQSTLQPIPRQRQTVQQQVQAGPASALRPHATYREMRRDVEAKRLVAEYALLRPGTQPCEIAATRLREIRSVIAASTRL